MGNFTFKGKLFCLALTMCFAMGINKTFAQDAKKPSQQEVDKLINSSGTIAFIENKGQWPNHVLFRADMHGAQMLATPQGMLVGAYDPASLSAYAAYETKIE